MLLGKLTSLCRPCILYAFLFDHHEFGEFGMSVSRGYLTATATMAAVAGEVGVDALVNMSRMAVSQLSI
jgi:hypothetical protein